MGEREKVSVGLGGWVFGKNVVGLVDDIISYLPDLTYLKVPDQSTKPPLLPSEEKKRKEKDQYPAYYFSFSFFLFLDILYTWPAIYLTIHFDFFIGLHQDGYTENSRYVIYTSSIRFSVQSSTVQFSQRLRWEEEDDVVPLVFLFGIFLEMRGS